MKNPAHVVTVTKEKHANVRVKQNLDFAHAKELNLAAVMITELSAATANFPVIFIQHPETKVVRPVAMFGLRPGENYFYGQDGWDATYVPLLIQRQPFPVSRNSPGPGAPDPGPPDSGRAAIPFMMACGSPGRENVDCGGL